MAGYETTVVFKPSASEDLSAQLKTKVEGIIKNEGGELLNYEDWGNRKLAFTRQRETKGRYHYFAFTGKSTTVAEIERNLRINEHVMLYLSIRKNDGESSEDLTALKEMTAMTRPRERAPNPGFGGGDFGGGGRGRGPREEGSRFRE